MFKKISILLLLAFIIMGYSCIKAFAGNDTVISNNYFSFAMPGELKDIYTVDKFDNGIYILEKVSAKSEMGGFAFGFKIYKNPKDYTDIPNSKKLGELTDKKGVVYDMVLARPSEIQYEDKMKENYERLYALGEKIEVKGINGNKYVKSKGMKGKDLYGDILKKYVKAIKENWDSEKYAKAGMGYIYPLLAKTNEDLLDKIGFAYYDINSDGIDELFIGGIIDNRTLIFDAYTMKERRPAHVFSGGDTDRYYICDNFYICNEFTENKNDLSVFFLESNTDEMNRIATFIYDKEQKNPWFVAYGDNGSLDNITKKEYNKNKKFYQKYKKIDYMTLQDFLESKPILEDRYNYNKEYFDYSVVLNEFPKDYYYTTIKINKSKERILIITDKVKNDSTYQSLFYYVNKNGFVYPLGRLESTKPLLRSKNYLYLSNEQKYIKFYVSDKKFEIVKSEAAKLDKDAKDIKFENIKSADKFKGDYGEPAGDDVVKAKTDGFYFEYHKPQYKKKYIKSFMQECINDGVKTQVQMYCCMINKLHP